MFWNFHVINLSMSGFRWKAQNYSQFWGKTLAHGIKYRLGTYHPMKYTSDMSSIKYHLLIIYYFILHFKSQFNTCKVLYVQTPLKAQFMHQAFAFSLIEHTIVIVCDFFTYSG